MLLARRQGLLGRRPCTSARRVAPERPVFSHPPFDFETRIATVDLATDSGALTVASVYVPNGGKDFPAKMRFLEAMDAYAAAFQASGQQLALLGDFNVARTDRDVHPKERKPRAIGQLPEERALIERILSRGLVDVGRALDPDNDGLFTWWPPWRNMRQRNIGWRLDYVFASEALASRAISCPCRRTSARATTRRSSRHSRSSEAHRPGTSHHRTVAPSYRRTIAPSHRKNAMSDVLDRFLSYVRYDTQSNEASRTYPSTDSQLVLLRALAAELGAIGLADAAVDEFGYVMATIPATTRKAGVPTIGFIAHVDTSPEMSGADVTADRPSPVRRPGSGAARRPVRGLAPGRQPRARRSDRPRHRHGVRHDAARRRQQGGRRRNRDGGGLPRRASRDPARHRAHRLHAGRGGRPRHRRTSTSRASAPAAPTRWTAAAAATSRPRASRPTR